MTVSPGLKLSLQMIQPSVSLTFEALRVLVTVEVAARNFANSVLPSDRLIITTGIVSLYFTASFLESFITYLSRQKGKGAERATGGLEPEKRGETEEDDRSLSLKLELERCTFCFMVGVC